MNNDILIVAKKVLGKNLTPGEESYAYNAAKRLGFKGSKKSWNKFVENVGSLPVPASMFVTIDPKMVNDHKEHFGDLKNPMSRAEADSYTGKILYFNNQLFIHRPFGTVNSDFLEYIKETMGKGFSASIFSTGYTAFDGYENYLIFAAFDGAEEEVFLLFETLV